MRELPPYTDIRADDGGLVRIWLDGKIDMLTDSPAVAGFKAAMLAASARPEGGTIDRRERHVTIVQRKVWGPDDEYCVIEVQTMIFKEGDRVDVMVTPVSPLARRSDDAKDAARYREIRREVVEYNTREANTKMEVGNLCEWADAVTPERLDADIDECIRQRVKQPLPQGERDK